MAQQSTEHKEVIRLLKEHGAVLERTKKHHIWKMPDGRSYTLPSTPSCVYSWKNNLADLRKFLGIVDPDRGSPGKRRRKKVKKSRQRFDLPIEVKIAEIGPTKIDALLAFRAKLMPRKVYIAEPEYVFLKHLPDFYYSATPTIWWKPWTWI